MKTTLVTISCFVLSIYGWAQGFESQNTPQGVLITEYGQKVLFYQKETTSLDGRYPRANYIHPLYDLQGKVITEDFPEDHKHHRGIFWTWHQVVVNGQPMGDAWECKDFSWDVKDVIADQVGENLQLQIKTHWGSPHYKPNGQELPFVEEYTKITIYPRDDNYRMIDFEIALTALAQNVQIGGSNDVKGYGGFSTRFKLPSDIKFTSLGKTILPKNKAVQAGRGMQINGRINADQNLGVLVVASKSNPIPNNLWILRSENSMQNPVYPGAELIPISRTTPTILKYRIVIYNSQPSKQELDLWQEF